MGALKEAGLYTAPQIIKILNKIPFTTGYKKYLQDDFQKFFESFGKVYKDFIKKKDPAGLSEFKKSIGGKWNKLLQRAKKTKDLTTSDTKKQQLLSASNIGEGSLVRLRWNKILLIKKITHFSTKSIGKLCGMCSLNNF